MTSRLALSGTINASNPKLDTLIVDTVSSQTANMYVDFDRTVITTLAQFDGIMALVRQRVREQGLK